MVLGVSRGEDHRLHEAARVAKVVGMGCVHTVLTTAVQQCTAVQQYRGQATGVFGRGPVPRLKTRARLTVNQLNRKTKQSTMAAKQRCMSGSESIAQKHTGSRIYTQTGYLDTLSRHNPEPLK